MNRLRPAVLAAALLAGGLGAGAPGALAATCTVVPGGLALIAHIPSAGVKYSFPFPDLDPPLAIPVDIDAQQGTITLRRAGLPTISVDTDGPSVGVVMGGADASGHIDAEGNVTIPGFDLDTLFLGETIPTHQTLTSGAQSKLLNTVEYPVGGSQLDFATGLVRLEGADIIPFAPIVEQPVVSGIGISCRLDPIPDPATLPPAGVRLAAVKGVAKIGTNDKGDTLTLHARVLAHGAPLGASGDVYVQLTGAVGQDLATVLVRGESFSIRGHRLPTRTVDGEGVKLLSGQKVVDNQPVTVHGSMRLGGRDTAANLNLRLTGLDLSTLTDRARVIAEIGGQAGSADVTVRGTGKRRRLR